MKPVQTSPGPKEPLRYKFKLLPGQRAELYVLDVETGVSELLFASTEQLFESPNWHPSGQWIIVNADGLLYRARSTAPSGLERIEMSGIPDVNNDHVVSNDGRWHYLSANDWHLYRVAWEGGRAERITAEKEPTRAFRHFLHGISPDDRVLAYVGTELLGGDDWGKRAVWLLDLETGKERLLGDGYSPADGPDFSPDGMAVYFNSERASGETGRSQLFRHELASGAVQQLTFDERVNWFPHPSPNGRYLAYLSYPPGTAGHPADRPVQVHLLDLVESRTIEPLALPGGQGTINVPCWAPDSRRLAYIAYPTDGSHL